jgi:hypothetical protein
MLALCQAHLHSMAQHGMAQLSATWAQEIEVQRPHYAGMLLRLLVL